MLIFKGVARVGVVPCKHKVTGSIPVPPTIIFPTTSEEIDGMGIGYPERLTRDL